MQAVPGTYQVVPLFRRKGESAWFKAVQYENGCTDEEWLYEVKPPTTLPSLRKINLENQDNSNFFSYRIPDDEAFGVVYTISNKNLQALKGTVKAVWEREFKLKSNSYRPGHKYQGAINDNEWFDELGSVDIEIESGVRYWRGIIECKLPVKRVQPTYNGTEYAGGIIHLYWRAEGSSEWVLLRLDADYLFNRNYTGLDIWDETTNYS